jgi:hypothetical protein
MREQLLKVLQSAKQNHDIKVSNKSFKNAASFNYSRMTVINQNYCHEDIKSRLNPANICYHSVQNMFVVFPSPIEKPEN